MNKEKELGMGVIIRIRKRHWKYFQEEGEEQIVRRRSRKEGIAPSMKKECGGNYLVMSCSLKVVPWKK